MTVGNSGRALSVFRQTPKSPQAFRMLLMKQQNSCKIWQLISSCCWTIWKDKGFFAVDILLFSQLLLKLQVALGNHTNIMFYRVILTAPISSWKKKAQCNLETVKCLGVLTQWKHSHGPALESVSTDEKQTSGLTVCSSSSRYAQHTLNAFLHSMHMVKFSVCLAGNVFFLFFLNLLNV